MKHISLLVLLYFISIALFANSDMVSYYEKAPLIEHLNSINKEWDKQKDIPTDLLTIPMKFKTDEERIQLHLKLVESILHKRSSHHLSVQQFANRNKNLESLVEYWQEGRFPINTHHSQRQPYFIDDYGTACAVGHLLLTSGEEQLAHHISNSQNYAYIHEMNYTELDEWAVENGFTKDELAWIQPGYGEQFVYYSEEIEGLPEYSDTYEPLGQQEIKTMMTLPDESMILMGGNFLHYDTGTGVQTASVFGYDGENYISFGDAIQGTVYAFEYFNGKIYAAGDFVLQGTDFYNIAYWNGTDWVGVQSGSMEGIVRDMVVYDCRLYIGGDFTKVNGGNIAYFGVWDEAIWSTTPQDCDGQSAVQPLFFNAPINTFEVYGNKLAIGGDFTQVVGNSNSVEGLILWDDLSIEILPTHGNMTSVNQLETYEEALIVGAGSLYAYRWDKWYYPGDTMRRHDFPGYEYVSSQIWTIPAMTGINDIFYSPPTNPSVWVIEFSNLIISTNDEVRAIRGKPAAIISSAFSSDYNFTVDGVVSAMGELGDRPFYGGNFNEAIIYNDSLEARKVLSFIRYAVSDYFPIELAEFTVKSNDDKTAQLAWTSLTESNSAYYEIERRTDNEDFMRVGTVAAAGESLEEIDYRYEDDISKVKGNYIYYRLKMVDKDGSYEYSAVRSLKLDMRDSDISIAPNPAVNNVELSMKMKAGGDVNVYIYDMQGRQLYDYQWTYGDHSIVRERIDVSQLETGIYLVQVISPHERETMKLNVLR